MLFDWCENKCINQCWYSDHEFDVKHAQTEFADWRSLLEILINYF
jgi:hypothetical protein